METRDELTKAITVMEVAEDEYAAHMFRQTRMRRGSRPSAWAPIIERALHTEMVEARAKVEALSQRQPRMTAAAAAIAIHNRGGHTDRVAGCGECVR